MKNRIFMLLLVCNFIAKTEKTFSQSYLSLFGDTSTSWDFLPFIYCDFAISEIANVQGDTILGTKSYKIISGFSGYLREDTMQGKAWFYDTTYNSEYLVMNLSLSVGDSFIFYNQDDIPTSIGVDSVFYANGKKHVRLNAWVMMCNRKEKIFFLEGSGTNAGLNYQRDTYENEAQSYMLCHNKNGVKVAGNVSFEDTCFVYGVGMNQYSADISSIKIFPNPCTEEFSIESKNVSLDNCMLSIYTVLGGLIFSRQLTEERTTINVSNFKSGLYFVVISDSMSIHRKRLIKL